MPKLEWILLGQNDLSGNFSARLAGKLVHLRWQTAVEENNEGFVVQRSADGIGWTVLGRVASGGNDYAFTDELPLPGNSFYRVKQIGTEGNFTYSQVATVRLDKTEIIASLIRSRISSPYLVKRKTWWKFTTLMAVKCSNTFIWAAARRCRG